ncbi:hypothetical protein CK203_059656 [Vitis vinifera]|uniref:Reverse transcriptase/retrotransposon-derived protein RNase H-like domain-containing protein n=1 Tax=Vitis vinifera TaxID=29760 RepID=A0A438H107_VITVI|nr:hypothetical protein CK203_059656 [Vitis vinifera]
MEGMQNDLSQKIDNIQYSISRLTNLNTVIEKGKFPSQPSQNPRVFMKLKPKMRAKTKKSRVGRKVHPNQALKEEPRIVIKEDMMKKHMPPPFPQALHGKKEIKNSSEILEVLRQVKVNIPLLDMIKQVPTYAKFLKDLCTVKRGLQVTKNAFLTEQVSAIIRPTTMTLSLADRSVKIPRGVIEDVLVQVDKFYYPVDFVVLDTDSSVKEENYLTFGNMTLEVNIFHLCKRHLYPEEEEGFEEVCLINTLVEEHCDKSLEESLNENLEVLEDGFPEPSDVLAIMSPWRRREEILPLFNQEDSQGVAVEDPPKLILKPLPVELKYAYLEDDEKCPVVVSSTLTSDQEDSLLGVLRKCKKAIGWQISDLKGISPLVCTHHIYMEDDAKPVRQPQRRLNPHMQEVVRSEVLKLLQAGIIYPISDSLWVSPTQVVPKKSGITVIQNEKGRKSLHVLLRMEGVYRL